EQSEPSAETTSNPEDSFHDAPAEAQAATESESPETHDEPDLSMEDFAAALESFDREQAAEAAAQAFDDSAIVTGTGIKLTDKHVVVDVGMKSEGLIPIEQVVDHAGQPKLKPGDSVDVVIEREEPDSVSLLGDEKAQRLWVWDTVEKAHNEKTAITGTVVGRVKGGLTVDIGIKAFL